MRYAYLPGGYELQTQVRPLWQVDTASCVECGCYVKPDLYAEGDALCRSCIADQRVALPTVDDWALLELRAEVDVYDLLELETSAGDIVGRAWEGSRNR